MKNFYDLMRCNDCKYIFEFVIQRLFFKKYSDVDYFDVCKIEYSYKDFLSRVNDFYILNESVFSSDIIVEMAETIIRRRISFLGYSDICVDKTINWHKDYIFDYEWDRNLFYKDVKKNIGQVSSDIKNVWEISRFHHLLILGEAYYIAKNEQYALDFYQQIMDWIENNPVEYGANWCCTMEVAIRSVNMLLSAYYFLDSQSIPSLFWEQLAVSLYQHMVFIRNNLELGIVKGNHYLADICGLVILSRFFQETKEGKKYFRYAVNKLFNEIHNQVYPDGTDHEGSTSYHALVTELFLYTTIFLKRWGIKIPNSYMLKLKQLIATLKIWMKSNGTIPLIGDADDSRFICYSLDKTNQPGHLIDLAAIVFDEKSFKIKDETRNSIEILSFLGKAGLEKYNSYVNRDNSIISKSFSNSGYFIFRDEKFYLLCRAGDIGLKGRGGHGHCDQLSFELNINGIDIFVDPGSYIYSGDPEKRNLFRSTKYHNTVMIDGLEQNRFDSQKLFTMDNDTKTKVLKYQLADENFLLAEHYGYRKKVGVVHRREFYWNKVERSLLLKDSFFGQGQHLLEWFFHLSNQEFSLQLDAPGKIRIIHPLCQIELEYDNSLEAVLQDGLVSSAYGIKEAAEIICLYKKIDLEKENSFKIKIKYFDGDGL